MLVTPPSQKICGKQAELVSSVYTLLDICLLRPLYVQHPSAPKCGGKVQYTPCKVDPAQPDEQW